MVVCKMHENGEILHNTMKDTIIHNPLNCFQPNLTLAIYKDTLSCRESLEQII